MNTHIPTIPDLNRKTVRELHAMFRNAASIATSDQSPAPEREAAQKTLEDIKRSLSNKQPRP
jgi:hypothetical protein